MKIERGRRIACLCFFEYFLFDEHQPGNGLTRTIGYDNQYRITGITTGAVMNLSYPTYDYNGNIQAINDQLDPAKNKSFTYDTLDRLSTATASGIWGSLGWTYDGVGNRLTENSSSYTYYANSNRLYIANGISFGYDNNGNTTTESARQYIYNQNQRLIQVNDGATTVYYTYNSNGQRVKKNVNGTATIFHYSLNGQIIAESNSSGTITAEYVYLNGQPLAKIEGPDTYYYHNDHLATPQKMTDSSGVVRWSADYKPFGEVNITTSDITNNLRFSGQYYDTETGTHYNYFRDYNPIVGRFVESDPLNLGSAKNLFPEIADKLTEYYKTNPGSQNLYVYVQNAPTRQTDPPGLLGWDTVIKQIVKQVGKKLGGKAVDSGGIDIDPAEGDDDGDGVPNYLDPEYPPNQPCTQCHAGPQLPEGWPCVPKKK